MTVALIRAVENVRLTIFIFYQTHIFNGYNQRNDHMQRQQNLHVLVALALYFQNHHHLCLQLSVGLSSNICREARFLGKKICPKYGINRHEGIQNKARGVLILSSVFSSTHHFSFGSSISYTCLSACTLV